MIQIPKIESKRVANRQEAQENECGVLFEFHAGDKYEQIAHGAHYY